MKNAIHTLSKAAILAAVSTMCAAASAATCKPLAGFVRLVPETACTITSRYPGNAYLAKAGTCFSASLLDMTLTNMGTGFSGLTIEKTVSPILPANASTPAVLHERSVPAFTDEFGLAESRRFFTARSAIVMADGLGTIYTADAGVIHGTASTEELVIVGGTGAYTYATGSIFAWGKMINGWAQFDGKIGRAHV